MENPDRLNLKEWTIKRQEEMIQEIKHYINNGWNKQKALDFVLNESCIGTPAKSQIKYEIKYYQPLTQTKGE